MAEHAQVDFQCCEPVASPVRIHQVPLLAGALLCLLSAWYFARVIAPAALGASAPSVQQGLMPEWIGCRAILHRRNPYRLELTQQIEVAIYGKTVSADSVANQHRFAYPAFFIFLFFPMAILPFHVAQLVMLLAGVALSARSVIWWTDGRSVSNHDAVAFAILVFAAYPVVVCLQLRQPTLIIAALLAFSLFCVRSGRLALAGAVAALASAKPQLAVAVLLPLSAWAVASWRKRKAFVFSLAASLLALTMASELAVPGWLSPWLHTVRAYSHYAGARPLLADLTHEHFFIPAAVLLISAVIWVSFEFGDTDLLFSVSFSIAAFQLLFPFQMYNEILLLPAALWAVKNADRIRERGQLHVLLFSCAWIALAGEWIAMLALSWWDIAAPGSGLKLWQVPLVATWLYPMLLFAALASFAASCLLPRSQVRIARSRTA